MNLMNYFWRTFETVLSPLTIAIWLFTSIGAVLAGPFGTFDSMSLELRLLYWPIVSATSILLGYTGYASAHAVTKKLDDLETPLIAGALGTVLVAADIWWLSKVVFGISEIGFSFATLLLYVGFVFSVVVFGRKIMLSSIREVISSKDEKPEAPVVAPIHEPRLLRRLPKLKGQAILRLSAADHLIEVATDTSTESLRLRLRDAIDEMDGIEGALVHRSHWVALDAIKETVRENGKVFLRLRNGDLVPVSRKNQQIVEALPNLAARQARGEAERSEVSAQ
jgi:hypothetical protein